MEEQSPMDARIAKLRDALRSLGGPTDLRHKSLNDDSWYDSVEILTVPRYKTSGLSGDEWRFSYVVRFIRKNHILYEQSFGNLRTAAAWLSWGLIIVGETEDISLKDDEYYCANLGCPLSLATFYRIKKLYNWDGSEAEYQYPAWRGFCSRHSQRGDSDMEDNDSNYRWFAGERPSTDTDLSEDARPSANLGFIDLTESEE